MTELLFPSLTGTKTDCLFGEVGFIFSVLIKALWLTSPTGTSKRLVHAEIPLPFIDFLGFDTYIVNCLCYSLLVYRVFVQRSTHPSLTTYHDIIIAWGCMVHSSRHPRLTGLIYLSTGIYVQNCGHPSLKGLIYV